MLQDTTIAFIGSGMMGQAMIAGLVNQNLVKPDQIVCSDILVERGRELEQSYGVRSTTNNIEAAQSAEIIILAVKPQIMPQVLPELKGQITTETLVISIAAGVTMQTLQEGLGHELIVRVMPNTPAQIGQGMSGWTTRAAVSPRQKEQARLILQTLGEEIFMEQEYFLDMVTALSGSGPAYIFLFMEALIDASVQMGLSRPMAQKMVFQTVEGSLAYAKANPCHLAELRNIVTSPGGTTADALYELEKGGFRTVLTNALLAAYQKSKALGAK